jgi:hypothetical protein
MMIRCSSGRGGALYKLWGNLLTADGVWSSGYRRGLANSGELQPTLQFKRGGRAQLQGAGDRQRRGAGQVDKRLRPYFPNSQWQRDRGFFAHVWPRRTLYAGIKIPLAALLNRSP